MGPFEWLEVGLGLVSRDLLVGRGVNSGCGLPVRPLPSKLLRLDATDPARFKPAGELTLQRLTLSVRFIMALWTNPPIPFVGEAGLVGELRPDVVPSIPVMSAGGPNCCAVVNGKGDPSRPWSAGELGVSFNVSFSFSVDVVRAIPGDWVRIADMSKVSPSSTWLRRNAAEFCPLSAV